MLRAGYAVGAAKRRLGAGGSGGAALRVALTCHKQMQHAAQGSATPLVDLLPDRSAAQVLEAVRHPRGARSLASHLKSRLGIDGLKAGVLYEVLSREQMQSAELLAATLKAVPLRLTAPRPIDEAISSAGGVRFDAFDSTGMLAALPGVFCAGEMLDWEAPTGGYLLTAVMASGAMAARAALGWVGRKK
ncbi:MAG: hypothetical protein EOO40_11280 [Deltaproteobacteria bacterium]|nr:MAG: hypothetical protein EOO40_11280 [Deltaproteobacteria bacterium]